MVSKTQRNSDKCDINTFKIEKKNGQTIANKQSAYERKDKKKLTFIYCASFYVYSSIRNSITNSRHKSIIHHLLKTFIQIDIQDLSPSRKTLMICLSFFPFFPFWLLYVSCDIFARFHSKNVLITIFIAGRFIISFQLALNSIWLSLVDN